MAAGVMEAVAQGIIDRTSVDDLLLIAAVWVDPDASIEDLVYENNRNATRLALLAGVDHAPSLEDALGAADRPFNAFFRPEA